MNSPRRGLRTAIAVDVAALALIVASVPVGWLWLDHARPSGLRAGTGGPAVTASAGPAGPAGPTGSVSGSGTPSPTMIIGTGTWTATASLPQPIWGSGSVVLPDGRVLVVGGTTGTGSNQASNTTFLFDPATAWTKGSSMLVARAYPMVALLRDGSVLVAGGSRNGQPLDTAERYLPDSGAWVAAGRMNVPRTHGTATVLGDGRVLLAGGGSTGSPGFKATAAAEIFDPAAGTWTATGSMAVARTLHTASLLRDGTVLVAGGAAAYFGTTGAVAWTAEIYDPVTGTWHKTARMATTRYFHAAAVLQDGRVMVAGGWARTSNTDPSQATVEMYDPSTGQWTAERPMSSGRARLRLAVLPDGRVLAAGGVDPAYKVLASSDIYDPNTGQWHPTGNLTIAVMWPVLATLNDGHVLIAGGATDATAHHLTGACALYAPPPR